jgi:uncharacterized protein YbdZ (MbtH family)
VVMAWVDGMKQANVPGGWAGLHKQQQVKAVMGHMSARRRR